MKYFGPLHLNVTEKLRSYGAEMKVIGNAGRQEFGRWLNNALRIHTCQFDDENVRCCVSDGCEVCRNSSPFIRQFTTTSIRSATFTHAMISSSIEHPLSRCGGTFVPGGV